jgi:hypothetical protein
MTMYTSTDDENVHRDKNEIQKQIVQYNFISVKTKICLFS